MLKSTILADGKLSQLSACNIDAQFFLLPDLIARFSSVNDLKGSGTLQFKPNIGWPIMLSTKLSKIQPFGEEDSLEVLLESKMATAGSLPMKLKAIICEQSVPTSEFRANAQLKLKHSPPKVSAQINSSASRLNDLKRWIKRLQSIDDSQTAGESKSCCSQHILKWSRVHLKRHGEP